MDPVEPALEPAGKPQQVLSERDVRILNLSGEDATALHDYLITDLLDRIDATRGATTLSGRDLITSVMLSNYVSALQPAERTQLDEDLSTFIDSYPQIDATLNVLFSSTPSAGEMITAGKGALSRVQSFRKQLVEYSGSKSWPVDGLKGGLPKS